MYVYRDEISFETLKGKTLVDVSMNKYKDEITFTCDSDEQFKLYHDQDCCESVCVEDIVGDLQDLIGEPILEAEEATSDKDPEGYKSEDDWRESFTWTFYKLGTRKGSVTIRWLGESNGGYSESVSFVKL